MRRNLSRVLQLLVGVGFLAFLNYLVIQGWFGKDGPANLGSIEVSYVSMGRFLADFGWRSWTPFWYLGFPFHLFYTPLLPTVEWILYSWWQVPLWEGYRLVTGAAYILSPLGVFFLGWVLSRRWVGGLVAGGLYSVGPTSFYWLDSGVRGDRFSQDFWDPRRLVILVRWGEGPHLLSLVFLPSVGAFFAAYLRGGKRWQGIIAAFFLGLAGVANALGLMGWLLFLFFPVFARY